MVNGELFAARTTTTVLTGKSVPFEHVATAERHNSRWQAVVADQCDDLGNFQIQPLCANHRIALGGLQVSPVLPGVELKGGRIDNPGGLVPDFGKRPRYGADGDRLPVAVEHQRGAFQNR